VTLLDRIADVLADREPGTTADTAAELNDGVDKDEHTEAETVRPSLNRDVARGRGRFIGRDEGWTLRSEEG
jgi:hypothetical protein